MPSYDLKCQSCGKEWERFSTIGARYEPCDCGGAVEQLHKHSVQGTPFIPYFDFALGEQINSMPERKRAMRNAHVDYRDKMSPGDLSARRDRVHQERQEQRKT